MRYISGVESHKDIRQLVKLVREAELAVDVEVRVVERDDLFDGVSYLPPEEAQKLDAVRRALRNRDIRTASDLARRVFTLRWAEAEVKD